MQTFTLIGRPTLRFQLLRAFKACGVIPCVYGVTECGRYQTTARVADVVIGEG